MIGHSEQRSVVFQTLKETTVGFVESPDNQPRYIIGYISTDNFGAPAD